MGDATYFHNVGTSSISAGQRRAMKVV